MPLSGARGQRLRLPHSLDETLQLLMPLRFTPSLNYPPLPGENSPLPDMRAAVDLRM